MRTYLSLHVASVCASQILLVCQVLAQQGGRIVLQETARSNVVNTAVSPVSEWHPDPIAMRSNEALSPISNHIRGAQLDTPADGRERRGVEATSKRAEPQDRVVPQQRSSSPVVKKVTEHGNLPRVKIPDGSVKGNRDAAGRTASTDRVSPARIVRDNDAWRGNPAGILGYTDDIAPGATAKQRKEFSPTFSQNIEPIRVDGMPEPTKLKEADDAATNPDSNVKSK